MQYYGLDKKYIPYAAERNKVKWENIQLEQIKLISENEARKLNPYFFCNAMGVYKKILSREKNG